MGSGPMLTNRLIRNDIGQNFLPSLLCGVSRSVVDLPNNTRTKR